MDGYAIRLSIIVKTSQTGYYFWKGKKNTHSTINAALATMLTLKVVYSGSIMVIETINSERW